MPTMIPDIEPRTIENDGERTVYAALKEQLPPEWTVRHDLVFCRKRGRKITPDGQLDFVVVIPGHGLLFLEVKGLKDAIFIANGGQCYWKQKNGSRMKTGDPFAQAQANKHDLIQMIQHDLKMGQYFQGRYGHAVVFPFVGEHGTLPVSHEPQIVWCHPTMCQLEDACRQALNAFGNERAAENFTSLVEKDVCAWLRDRVKLVPVAAADIVEDERKIESLTRQQYEAVSGVLGNPRVRIEGVAGSGKTLIALWAAKQFADEGKKVLLCCFNKGLSAWLKAESSSDFVTVNHFHALANELCKKAGSPLPGKQTDDSFWTETVPIQLMDALDRLGDQAMYDVILVDEAQDFHVNWWTPIEMMLKESSKLHIFLDSEQGGIYNYNQEYPCSETKYSLTANCRNSQSITKIAGSVINTKIPCKIGMPEGVDPVIRPAETVAIQRGRQLNTLVNQLIKEGHKPQDIAILSPWGKNNKNCSIVPKINHIEITDDVIKWRKGDCFWGSTIKAFKGLDAKCIILIDIPEYNPPSFTKTDLYIGLTRARHYLYVIPVNKDFGEMITQTPC